MRVVHVGLGSIGLEVARAVGRRRDLESVAAIDVRVELVGHRLGDLLGEPLGSDIEVADQISDVSSADVALLCTGSSFDSVESQLLELIERRLNVVSTCEELSYPWEDSPDAARRVDRAARIAGVTVLGTGVNPGFVMDFLPVVASGTVQRVDHIHVHRIQDAGKRRLSLQRKVGEGMAVAEFRELAAAGKLGHVGLRESARQIAAAMGWQLTSLEEAVEPVIATQAISTGLGEIAPGDVAGIHHTVTASAEGREVISLVLDMAAGIQDLEDKIVLVGDPSVSLKIPGGLHGDVATAAVVVNSIHGVFGAEPGLRTMTELPPPRAGQSTK